MKTRFGCAIGSYARHECRRVEPLDGVWEFTFHERAEPGKCPPMGRSSVMAVPQAFDATPAFRNRRGVGVYRKEIAIEPGTHAHLEFESVGMLATVLVDGEVAAQSRCSYLPFEAALPPSTARIREIVVLADNRFSESEAPLHAPYYDFRQYGGILGSVRLHHTGPTRLTSLRLQIESADDGRLCAEVEINDRSPRRLTANIFIDSVPLTEKHLEFRDGRATFPLRIPNPRVWSPRSPHLHTVRVFLPELQDDLQVRTGLRTITTDGGALRLNGEPLRLAGVNRHENFPGFGSAVPQAQMLSDLMLIRELGGNFVRGSHYPQKSGFLDLCDELGILVWEEMLGWQQDVRHFTNPAYRDGHRKALAEMVLNHVNHPCVIMWGFLNEAATEVEEARATLEESFEIVRLLDPTRPVTYATCKGENDRFLEMADVLCFNIYPGWYGCEEDDGNTLRHIAPAIRALSRWTARNPALKDRPLMISEIGAEGIYGLRDASAPFYSEDFQAEYLREVDRALSECPEISGIALWHFADVLTFAGGRNIKRPRGFNNKGLFNEYRQPKLAAAAAAELFQRFLGESGVPGGREEKPLVARAAGGTGQLSACDTLR